MCVRPLFASLLLCVAACGSVNNQLPDGGDDDRADAGPDANVTGPITVTVLTDYGDVDSSGTQLPVGIPRQGAQVFFIESGGDYTLVTTGGDGIATSPDVHPGTTALIVRPQTATQYAIELYLALVPGTHVTDGPHTQTSFPISTLTPVMTVSAPTYGGATGYSLNLSCWSSYSYPMPNVFSVTLIDPCDRTNRTLLTTAYDSSGLRAYSTTQTDMNPGGFITMPAWQAAATFVANVSNIPAQVEQVYLSGNYYDGPDGNMGYIGLSGVPSGGGLVMQGPTAPVGSSLDLYTEFTTGDFTIQKNRLIRSVPGAPITAAMDLSAMLPFTTQPTLDLATRQIGWGESGTTNPADIVIGHGYWQIAASGLYVQLTVIGPHVGRMFQLPALPTEVQQLTPAASDNYNIYEMFLVDDTAAAGYLDLVEDAYANGRNLNYSKYGTSAETWISGGSNID